VPEQENVAYPQPDAHVHVLGREGLGRFLVDTRTDRVLVRRSCDGHVDRRGVADLVGLLVGVDDEMEGSQRDRFHGATTGR
jgi:hypothetical protein